MPQSYTLLRTDTSSPRLSSSSPATPTPSPQAAAQPIHNSFIPDNPSLRPWLFRTEPPAIPDSLCSDSDSDSDSDEKSPPSPPPSRGWYLGQAIVPNKDGEWYYHSGTRWWCFSRTTVARHNNNIASASIAATSSPSSCEVWKYHDRSVLAKRLRRRTDNNHTPNVERGVWHAWRGPTQHYIEGHHLRLHRDEDLVPEQYAEWRRIETEFGGALARMEEERVRGLEELRWAVVRRERAQSSSRMMVMVWSWKALWCRVIMRRRCGVMPRSQESREVLARRSRDAMVWHEWRLCGVKEAFNRKLDAVVPREMRLKKPKPVLM